MVSYSCYRYLHPFQIKSSIKSSPIHRMATVKLSWQQTSLRHQSQYQEWNTLSTRAWWKLKVCHIILTDNQVLIQTQLVGNKAKGQISKRVFQENKSRQILRKTNISSFHLVHSWIRVPKGLERMEKLENRPFLENGLERLDFCFWKNSIYL